MKQFIVNILLRLVGLGLREELGIVDKGKLQKFLFMCTRDDGWKSYYTLRKKSLLSLLSLGTGYNNNYWEVVGRLKELSALSANINQELQRREQLIKKQKEEKEDNIESE